MKPPQIQKVHKHHCHGRLGNMILVEVEIVVRTEKVEFTIEIPIGTEVETFKHPTSLLN